MKSKLCDSCNEEHDEKNGIYINDGIRNKWNIPFSMKWLCDSCAQELDQINNYDSDY